MALEPAAEPASRIQETQFTQIEQDESSNDTMRTSAGNEESPQASYGTAAQASSTSPQQVSTRAPRVLGPDLLRGLLMVLQSLDHASVGSGAWRHGQALESETDGQMVDTWNIPTGWIARSLTHLCAPGFMFLMGMGVVYFGRSRSKLGWSHLAMTKHFFVRAVVLVLVNEILGLIASPGKLILLNVVLLALAVNYFLAGLLWQIVNASEQLLATYLSTFSHNRSDEAEPLLASDAAGRQGPSSRAQETASRISFHAHNAVLLVLTGVTLWWNIWLSPTHGHCMPSSSSAGSTFLDFWFHPVTTSRVMSPFPPLAWLSFAIFGILYGRLVLDRPRPASTINAANACVGALLMLAFAATRLLHVGNLSEECLHMPEHVARPEANQYLTSFQAFFYVTKYPPSPAFFFYSMSLNLLLLAGFGSLPERVARRMPLLLTFGTCALFFYAVHSLVFFSLAGLAKARFGHDLGFTDPFRGEPARGIGNGPLFWVMWLLGLAIMYPLCRWYGAFKSRKAPDSVWRFF